MYFNNNGKAAKDYVKKIKKYAQNGIVLKANNDDSNYAAVPVSGTSTADVETIAPIHDKAVLYYGDADFNTSNDLVLINTAGTVQKKKFNLKDSNDVYYVTDSNGVVIYASIKKLYTTSSTDHARSTFVGGKEYFTE